MTAQIASVLFHTEKIVCRLYDPEKECIYKDAGMGKNMETICPAVLSAREIERLIGKGEVS